MPVTLKSKVVALGAVVALLATASCTRSSPGASSTATPSSPTRITGSGYVDTHMHVVPVTPGFAGGSAKSASSRSGGSDGYELATTNLLSLMDRYGVAQTILVSVPGKKGQEAADETSLQTLAANHNGRLYWMGGGATLAADLQNADAADTSARATSDFENRARAILDRGAIGFGEMISVHLCMSPSHSYQYARPDSPLFLALADVAAHYDVPIDIHMEALPTETPTPTNLLGACDKNPPVLPASIPAFERLLSHNPNTRIIWQHAGWDNTGHRTPGLTRELLAAHPNLYIALRVEKRLTQVGTDTTPMPNRIVTSSGEIDLAWLEVINAYPDRFVVGADDFITPDGQVSGPSVSYSETWSAIEKLPVELRAKVGRDNALRIYSLA